LGEDEEEFLAKNYERVTVNPLSIEEMDLIKDLIERFGYSVQKKDEKRILEEIFRKTYYAPRAICISLCMIQRQLIAQGKPPNLITLETLKQIPDTWERLYVDQICRRFGGVFGAEFYAVLKVASIMPDFTGKELLGVLNNYLAQEDYRFSEAVDRFISSELTMEDGDDDVYAFRPKWFRDQIQEVLSEEEDSGLREAAFRFFKGPKIEILESAGPLLSTPINSKAVQRRLNRENLKRLFWNARCGYRTLFLKVRSLDLLAS